MPFRHRGHRHGPHGIQSCRFNPLHAINGVSLLLAAGGAPGASLLGRLRRVGPHPFPAWAPTASGGQRAQTLCGVRPCSGGASSLALRLRFLRTCLGGPPLVSLARLRRGLGLGCGAGRPLSRSRAGPPPGLALGLALAVLRPPCSVGLAPRGRVLGLRAGPPLPPARPGPPPGPFWGAPLRAPGGCGGCRSGCPLGVAFGPPGRLWLPPVVLCLRRGFLPCLPPRPCRPLRGLAGSAWPPALGAPAPGPPGLPSAPLLLPFCPKYWTFGY